jgi:hypothetical protein
MTDTITTEQWVANNFVQIDPQNIDPNTVAIVRHVTFRAPDQHMVIQDNVEFRPAEGTFWIAKPDSFCLAELYLADGAGFNVYLIPNENDRRGMDVAIVVDKSDPLTSRMPVDMRFDIFRDFIEHTSTTGQIEEIREKIDRESAEVRSQIESAKAKLILCGDSSDPFTAKVAELLNALDEQLDYFDAIRAQRR